MQLPGFRADASLGTSSDKYSARAILHGADRSRVMPQGCDPFGCAGVVLSCAAVCASGAVPACVACLGGSYGSCCGCLGLC
jgi:hypothetical protein